MLIVLKMFVDSIGLIIVVLAIEFTNFLQNLNRLLFLLQTLLISFNLLFKLCGCDKCPNNADFVALGWMSAGCDEFVSCISAFMYIV